MKDNVGNMDDLYKKNSTGLIETSDNVGEQKNGYTSISFLEAAQRLEAGLKIFVNTFNLYSNTGLKHANFIQLSGVDGINPNTKYWVKDLDI